MQKAYIETKNLPFKNMAEQIVQATIDAHTADPTLHQIFTFAIPELELDEDNQDEDSAFFLITTLLKERHHELRTYIDIPLAAKIIGKTIESTNHHTLSHTPEKLYQTSYRDELVAFIIAYLTEPNTAKQN